jgi:ubiquinone/menaquinone biosynthesis C-methylase UbiE
MIKFIVKNIFHPIYKKQVAQYIANLCDEDSKILDYGCGDGKISKILISIKSKIQIQGIDLENRNCEIPITICTKEKIPYSDNTFDTTIAIDVLHHNESIYHALKEIKRVTKKYIIIKDHTANNSLESALVYCSDYLTNSFYKIKCFCNYPTLQNWYDFFDMLNLKIIEQPKNLNFGFGLTEHFNPIFKLEI